MGKGVIKSGGTAGLYTIDISRDTTAMDAWLVKLQQRLVDIDVEITAADAAVSAAKTELNTAVSAMNVLIDLFSADPSKDNRNAITEQSKVVAEKGKNHRIEKQKRDALVLDEASIQKQIEAIQAVDSLIETSAWCADYTEDLSGDVGTVEIPGDRTRLLIRPGDAGAAVYNASRDGQLQPTQSSTAAMVAWNYAMFPGWQKWIPQYRSATITAIDTDANTCTLTFGAETSTAQGLDVNYITASSDIPIQYMTCDHEAFMVNDIVLVEFESVTTAGTVDNWANPKVIGFIDNPKECPTTFGYRVQPNPGCETTDNDPECWNGWGAPFDDGGEPPVLINPPWGTAESGTQNQSLLVNQGGWQHWRDPQTQTWSSGTGTIDWQGNGMLCGWYGGEQGSRYRIHDQAFSVWYEGRQISVPNAVHGACVREFNGEKYIISASDGNNSTKVNVTHVDGTANGQSDDSASPYDLSGGTSTGSFWLFNSAGTEAVQIREWSGDTPSHTACTYGFAAWRRKMRLTVSLRVGGGGIIEPDVTVTDLGDEMPVLDDDPSFDSNYVFHTATRGTQGTMVACGPGFANHIENIQGLLEDEYWTRNSYLNYSLKFYDYVGNVEASAEFYNSRVWSAEHRESPCPIQIIPEYYDCGGGYGNPGDRRTGTNDSTFVTQEFPVSCSGSSINKCGVRFTGVPLADIEYESNDTFSGTGTSASGIFPENGFENRPSFGNTRNTITVSTFTRMSWAVPYMDMRYGQLISVLERKITDLTDSHSYDYAEPAQNEFWELNGSVTVNLKIDIYAGGALLNTEEREDVTAIVTGPTPSHFFNPYLNLAQNIHRKCRGYHGTAVVPDYLWQSPQKDPRPMASAGGNTYCISYVDRWVKDDEVDPPNEHIPPIRSVYNNFPVALNIPGTFPNAAPVTPVEPKAGG